MNKKNASKILQKQIYKLENLTDSQQHLWLIETGTYIDSFFGNSGIHHSYIKYFSFKNINSGSNKSEKDLYIEVKEFLNNCIDTINNIGIKKEPVDNWFSKLPNWAINLGLPALCFISFGVGILFTNNTNSKLRKENMELKEKSLLILSDTITNKHKYLSDSPKEK